MNLYIKEKKKSRNSLFLLLGANYTQIIVFSAKQGCLLVTFTVDCIELNFVFASVEFYPVFHLAMCCGGERKKRRFSLSCRS